MKFEPTARIYDIHGVRLSVIAQTSELCGVMDAIYGAFARPSLPLATDVPTVRIQLLSVESLDPVAAESGMRRAWEGPLPSGTQMTFWCSSDRRGIDLAGIARARVNLPERTAEIVAVPGGGPALVDACLIPLVSEFMNISGHYLLHAASLACNTPAGERAVLIAGPSGAGKSTTALALAKSGMTLLADDVSYVRPDRDGEDVWIYGLSLPSKVSANTINLLPWLADLPRSAAFGGKEYLTDARDKIKVRARILVKPAVILLLGERSTVKHQVLPVDKLEALGMLARENVRAYEPLADGPAGRAFAGLARLVGQCHTYRLHAAADLDNLYDIVMNLPFAR